MISKIYKPVTRLVKKKKKERERERERAQINKIRNFKGEITINCTEIQNIRDYYKQLYANKTNSKEMDKFL